MQTLLLFNNLLISPRGVVFVSAWATSAFTKIAARAEPSVKAAGTFIEYDRSVVPNLSRFISYPARDTHSYYGDAARGIEDLARSSPAIHHRNN